MKQWWQKEVVYQIYPKSFYDSNQDGIGDVAGIIAKLPYLVELGVTMLWICPIYDSPMDDNGYDIADYYGIHPDFGSMQDVEALIQEAKRFKIKIIMDLVVNHTSDEHAWFQDAVQHEDSPYRAYYIFKEGKDGKAPTNWRSVFGGSVWEKVAGSQNTYYFHAFSKKQPCLNWENPAMRKEIYQMINWWLEKGIAGFRVDAINFLKKNQAYPEGIADGADGLASCFAYCRNQPGIEVFYQELKEQTFARHQCMTVAEAYDVPYAQLGPYIDEVNGAFSLMFDFSYSNFDIGDQEEWFIRKPWTIKQYRDMVFHSQQEINQLGWAATFLENHDQPRSINKLIVKEEERTYESKTMLACMYFFMRGVPFIYQGQEIGMENVKRCSIDEFDDCSSISQYERALAEGFDEEQAIAFLNMRSRDHARTPMQWDATAHAGFSKAGSWLAVNTNYTAINVEHQRSDPDSVLSFYQRMIALRQHSELSDVLIYGDFQPIEGVPDDVIAYQRKYEGRTVSIYCNFSSQQQAVALQAGSQCYLNNYKTTIIGDGQVLMLQAYQCLLMA